MRSFLVLLFSTLFISAYAQDSIQYKPVVRVQGYPQQNLSLIKADQANGLMITCPSLEEQIPGIRYGYRIVGDLGKIKKDTKNSKAIWVTPSSTLMNKNKATRIEIEVWVIFPKHPVYIPGAWHKDQPLYDREGKVIKSNALWARISPAKGQPGEYLLTTETFAVTLTR